MEAIDYQNDICIWFIEGQEIGHREHHYDWKEGDVITTDGKETEIYAIVKNTPDNVELLQDMFIRCSGIFRGAKMQKQFFRKELTRLLTNPAQPNKWFKGIRIDQQDRKAILSQKFKEVDEKTFEKVFDVIDECLDEIDEFN